MTEQLSPLALQALAVVEESGAIINANHAHPHTIRHKGRIVNAPLLRECFIAEKAKGAWRNGERISVSSVTACENALIATGFPYEIASRVDEILERMRPVLSSCQGVRRCGAAALDLAWTACGRFDAFYEDELKPWDMAAGALLVTEAGGSISNLDGSPFDLRWSILAGNKAMHELIGKMIR